jgi:hypothetical protein
MMDIRDLNEYMEEEMSCLQEMANLKAEITRQTSGQENSADARKRQDMFKRCERVVGWMKGRKMDKIRLKKRIHKKEKGGNNC